MIRIVIGTVAEVDALPADVVSHADLIIARHPDDSPDFGNDGCFWQCVKDRLDLLGYGTCYASEHSALEGVVGGLLRRAP